MFIAVLAMAIVLAGGSRRVNSAPGTPALRVLQAELQRNFDVLRHEETPAYFIAYTVHDDRSTRLSAAFGAVERNDESRGRFASVEVRVGDYALDNTHPIRGDGGFGGGPRVSRLALPLTDEEPAIKQTLWRATDRAFKQATEALTRVKANVAAKIKEDDPAPDFSREEPQRYTTGPASYTLDARAWEAKLRRLSAPFAEDPLVFRNEVTLSVEADN